MRQTTALQQLLGAPDAVPPRRRPRRHPDAELHAEPQPDDGDQRSRRGRHSRRIRSISTPSTRMRAPIAATSSRRPTSTSCRSSATRRTAFAQGDARRLADFRAITTIQSGRAGSAHHSRTPTAAAAATARTWWAIRGAGEQSDFPYWFDPAAFAPPADGTYGNSPRAPFRLPGRNQTDLALSKNFYPWDSGRIQFRADFINAFNHTQFTTVDRALLGGDDGDAEPLRYRRHRHLRPDHRRARAARDPVQPQAVLVSCVRRVPERPADHPPAVFACRTGPGTLAPGTLAPTCFTSSASMRAAPRPSASSRTSHGAVVAEARARRRQPAGGGRAGGREGPARRHGGGDRRPRHRPGRDLPRHRRRRSAGRFGDRARDHEAHRLQGARARRQRRAGRARGRRARAAGRRHHLRHRIDRLRPQRRGRSGASGRLGLRARRRGQRLLDRPRGAARGAARSRPARPADGADAAAAAALRRRAGAGPAFTRSTTAT